MKEKKAVIIGGGVIGISCSYYLAKAGWNVTVIEKDRSGYACSRGNCGVIGIGHILPLNAPGAVFKTLKGMLKPSSPFAIRPRFDPKLWGWLTKFALRCNEDKMMQSARTRASLLSATDVLYNELFDNEPIDAELQRQGSLHTFSTKSGFEEFAKTNDLVRETFGAAADRLEYDDMMKLEPSLKEGLAGAWLWGCDYHLRPDVLMASWRKVVEALGVEFKEGTEVSRFSTSAGNSKQATHLSTSSGDVSADLIVVAMGAMTPLFNEHLGCRLPVQPGKGYSITQTRPAVCPKVPVFCMEHKVVATPFDSGYRLGSTMEFAGYDSAMRPKRLRLLEDAAKKFLKDPVGEKTEETWYGWRSMTYDGVPFIDRSPRFDNVLVATGHNMIGLTLAPITGKLIAEMADDRKTTIDTHPMRIGR